MKRNYALIALLFIIANCNAQSWNFINANERYHFQHVNDDIPLNTIFVDSVALEGTDSIFSLNRLFLPCDTCNSEDQLYLANQPSFLNQELIYSQVSSTVVLHDPEENIIKLPDLGIKEWWFNQSKDQMATLDTIILDDVLGVNDSIAIISINGEPEIKIAKQLGLIQYFDYEIKGYENLGIGTTLPTWKDFYDFKIGDVFMYYEDFNSFGAVPPQKYTFSKFKVSSINEYVDSLVIHWDENRVFTHYLHSENDSLGQIDFSTTNIHEGEYSNHSGSWNITSAHFSGGYHNELKTYPGALGSILMVAQFQEKNGVVELNYQKNYREVEDGAGFYLSNDTWNPIATEAIRLKYLPERGLMRSFYSNEIVLETDAYYQIGYSSDGDTTGFVFADDFFEPKETGNDFLTYVINQGGASEAIIDIENHEIKQGFHFGFGAAPAEFILSKDATAFIDGVEQISGVTENEYYFSDTLFYNVVAENGDAQEWKVIIDFEPNVLEQRKSYKVYPNPTTGIISIEGVEGATLVMFNALGEHVQTIDYATVSEAISMDAYNHGVYFVKIIKGNETDVVRFIYTE